jgi:hypothetical protein
MFYTVKSHRAADLENLRTASRKALGGRRLMGELSFDVRVSGGRWLRWASLQLFAKGLLEGPVAACPDAKVQYWLGS